MAISIMKKLSIKIEKVIYGGLGLGTYEGKKVFIPETFTGDSVHYEVTKDHKNYSEGRVLQTLEQSSHRIPSPCVYSEKCGGCQWINIDYKSQLEAKASFIQEAFERLGGLEIKSPIPMTPSSQRFHYRNRILLRGTLENGKVTVGFFQKESHTQIPIKKCMIAHEAHNRLIHYLNEVTLEKTRSQKFRLEIQVQPKLYENKSPCLLITLIPIEKKHELQDLCLALENYPETLFLTYLNENKKSPFFLFEENSRLEFYGKPGIFQQINTETNKLLREQVKRLVEKTKANSILDLYCGSGNLSLELSDGIRKITGVEVNKASIEVASYNVKKNSLLLINYKSQSAQEFLQEQKGSGLTDLLILDPPRRGAKEDLIYIKKLNPKFILYVSCDPTTAARDYKTLSDSYTLESLEGFDFFPQTYHVETLLLLKKKN